MKWVATFHLLDGTCLEGKPDEVAEPDVEPTASGFADAIANMKAFYFEAAEGGWHIVQTAQIARIAFHRMPTNPDFR